MIAQIQYSPGRWLELRQITNGNYALIAMAHGRELWLAQFASEETGREALRVVGNKLAQGEPVR